MSDYLDNEEVKIITDAFAEVTITIPIDSNTKFPVKILTEGAAEDMVLKALKEIKTEIINTTLFLTDDKALFNLQQIENIINNKIKEFEHESTPSEN